MNGQCRLLCTARIIRAVHNNLHCPFIVQLLFQDLKDQMANLSVYGCYSNIVFQTLRWKIKNNQNYSTELNMVDIIEWLCIKQTPNATDIVSTNIDEID